MPELPEVETVRRGLETFAVGREIADVVVLRDRAVRRHEGGAADLALRLRGAVPVAAVRRGKYLWLVLRPAAGGEPARALLVHLGMSGQVLTRAGAGDAPAHLRARLLLADGGELWFVDQRTFGHLLLTPLVPTTDGGPGGHGSDLRLVPTPVAHIARDVLDPLVAPGTPGRAGLVDRVRGRRTGLKRALLDQALVSGIGNIYADEGLWRCREHYERATASLSRARVTRVLDAVAEVMTEALAAGGTSFDALYVDVNGASGRYDRSLAVYGQAGRPCRRCGTPVVREPFMNRSSFRCPRCQRRPRGDVRVGPAG